MTDPIIKTVDVPCSAARAFDIFVGRISKWWPLDGHAVSAASGKAALAVMIEAQVGGAVYETMHDGARADWGKVLEYKAAHHLAMTWHPGTNVDKPTRVDVKFTALSENQTRVTLTHSGWEVWAQEADDKRRNYDTGWDFVFVERFGAAAA